jgi:agmatine/peptidylarginine deiminase
MNFLRIGDKILMPNYADVRSKEALKDFHKDINELVLEIEVHPVEIPEIIELARLGGVLNCVSWQLF